MTVFFLVAGVEIRREIHDGALSDVRQAMLPLAAAIGGVTVPALIYFAVNRRSGDISDWAVPTATDIAFAVGVLALLGRSIPSNVRVFLLTLAIVDDIIAVLVIAFCYSSGLHYSGFAVAAAGIVIVIALQRLGVGSAPAYVIPGAVVWFGLFVSGAHPTLAGVVLGLLMPVVPIQRRVGQREYLPPALRIEWALHPWVAYAIVPLFALANAGVSFAKLNVGTGPAPWVLTGIVLALVAGKPLGVFGVSWLLVRLGACRLPCGVSWQGIGLAALLAGIGFTLSVFVAMLAFADEAIVDVVRFGVLLGSVISGGLGIACGLAYAQKCDGSLDEE